MAIARLRQAKAIINGHGPEKDASLLHKLCHDLESVFWVSLVFVVQRCDTDYETEEHIHDIVVGDLKTVLYAKGSLFNPDLRSELFELKGPCKFLIPFFRGYVDLCTSKESLTIANVLQLIEDAIKKAPRPHEKFAKSRKTSHSVNPSVGEKRSIHSSSLNPEETESECSQRTKKAKKAVANKTRMGPSAN